MIFQPDQHGLAPTAGRKGKKGLIATGGWIAEEGRVLRRVRNRSVLCTRLLRRRSKARDYPQAIHRRSTVFTLNLLPFDQKIHRLKQLGKVINNVIRFNSVEIMIALIGAEKYRFHPGFMGSVNIPQHIVADKDHL